MSNRKAPHGSHVDDHYNVPSGVKSDKDFWVDHGSTGQGYTYDGGRSMAPPQPWNEGQHQIEKAVGGKYRSIRDGTSKRDGDFN